MQVNQDLEKLISQNLLSQGAFEALKKHDFPHRKLEDWRYTQFPEMDFSKYTFEPSQKSQNLNEITYSCVFDNGQMTKNNLPAAFKEVKIDEQSFLDRINTSYEDTNFLSLLSTAIGRNIKEYRVEKSINDPVFFISNTAKTLNKEGLQAKVLSFQIKKGVSANLRFLNFTYDNSFSFETLWFSLEEGAELDLAFLNENTTARYYGKIIVHCKKGSKLRFTSLDTGSLKQKQEIHIYLHDSDIDVDLKGAYALNQKEHCEKYIRVHHLKEASHSNQFFKGILDGSSRGVFDGKIFVAKGADQTEAEQLNKNLIISSKAEADIKPQLEIYTDDVKCSHGATISRFLDDQIFYFQARGISKEIAIDLLARGFLKDCLNLIKDKETKEIFDYYLLQKVEQMKVANA